MARQPVAGAVKTRLGREIGTVAATWFYRHAARAVMLRLGFDRRWRTVLAIAPLSGAAARVWPPGIQRERQPGGDLGARMQSIMERARPGPVIIIGTDIPAIRPLQIAQAFGLLGGHDAVFGPAGDGGYWLAGLRRCPRVPRPFGTVTSRDGASVRWSTPHALADTVANLTGRRVALACPLDDVDNAHDFGRARAHYGRLVLPAHTNR